MPLWTRRLRRHAVRIAVSFQTLTSAKNPIHSGITYDLSLSGLSLFSPTTLESDTPVRVWLLDRATSQLTSVDGKIAWIKVEDLYGDSPYWVRAGISFDQLESNQQRAILAMLPKHENSPSPNRARKHLLSVLP